VGALPKSVCASAVAELPAHKPRKGELLAVNETRGGLDAEHMARGSDSGTPVPVLGGCVRVRLVERDHPEDGRPAREVVRGGKRLHRSRRPRDQFRSIGERPARTDRPARHDICARVDRSGQPLGPLRFRDAVVIREAKDRTA
jgi:hypothetical protein